MADEYDRLRPGPPAAALAWLVPQNCEVAVDLAAGTGLFTRALQPRVMRVVAVEPDDRMRAVLAARSPGVRAVAGRGEAIPLPDASADAVFVSSAWHWLDPVRAVAEIARVLRDGGRLGLIWTGRDRRTADWMAALDMVHSREAVASDQDAVSRPRHRHEVTLPDDAPFENMASASFTFARTMTVDDAVGWQATYSRVIVAADGERADRLASARDALRGQADSSGMVEIPMRSACWRADRAHRPG